MKKEFLVEVGEEFIKRISVFLKCIFVLSFYRLFFSIRRKIEVEMVMQWVDMFEEEQRVRKWMKQRQLNKIIDYRKYSLFDFRKGSSDNQQLVCIIISKYRQLILYFIGFFLGGKVVGGLIFISCILCVRYCVCCCNLKLLFEKC